MTGSEVLVKGNALLMHWSRVGGAIQHVDLAMIWKRVPVERRSVMVIICWKNSSYRSEVLYDITLNLLMCQIRQVRPEEEIDTYSKSRL